MCSGKKIIAKCVLGLIEMTPEEAHRYIESRKDALRREIEFLRCNLTAEIEKTEARLDRMPVESYPEFQGLIGRYRDILDKLEGF